MTRRLKPPVPVAVRRRPDGAPATLRRAGRERTITRVAATWVRPAPWWSEPADGANADPLQGERTYYRVITDGVAAVEVFSVRDGQAWYLERILD